MSRVQLAMIPIIYATGSTYKQEELKIICSSTFLATPGGDQRLVGDLFRFVFRQVRMREVLERDLAVMVRHKARAAYELLKVPCIVEHGGLIFEDHLAENYPGGLTQPMWDALGAGPFLKETGGGGRRVVARAVVGYCDGSSIEIFTGDRHGSLSEVPRGKRGYYWDPIFQPDNFSSGTTASPRTYAEIADEPNGIAKKVHLSQSTLAMLSFLNHRLKVGEPLLFRGT